MCPTKAEHSLVQPPPPLLNLPQWWQSSIIPPTHGLHNPPPTPFHPCTQNPPAPAPPRPFAHTIPHPCTLFAPPPLLAVVPLSGSVLELQLPRGLRATLYGTNLVRTQGQGSSRKQVLGVPPPGG